MWARRRLTNLSGNGEQGEPVPAALGVMPIGSVSRRQCLPSIRAKAQPQDRSADDAARVANGDRGAKPAEVPRREDDFASQRFDEALEDDAGKARQPNAAQ